MSVQDETPRAWWEDLGSVRIRVQDWGGEGATIVLAHPTGFLGMVWQPVVAELRRQGATQRIYSFDARGHGLSSKPDSGYEWTNFAADLAAVLDRLDVHDALGVGHSAGATTTALVAADHPGRYRRLVLIDPILFDPDIAEFLRKARVDNPMAARTRTRRLVWSSREELRANYAARPPYQTWKPEALAAYVEHGTFERPDGEVELLCPGRIEAQVYENAHHLDAFQWLARIRQPTLVIRGEHTDAFPADRATHAMKTLADARLVLMEGLTHFMPMERPDEIARMLIAEAEA
jgi:lipase